MHLLGWKRLLAGWPWYPGEGAFPLFPISEFMCPVRFGRRPYGTRDPLPLDDADPFGWPVSEYEEALYLRPGMLGLADRVHRMLVPLWRGKDHGVSEDTLRGNPAWPTDLARKAPTLKHERFVLLLPLALSMTQNDKAAVRWALFGNSEQGPARGFWRGFFTAPGVEVSAEVGLGFFRDLLHRVYGESADLRKAGFRVLPLGDTHGDYPDDGPLPSWTADYLLDEKSPLRGVRYLVTFRPFARLPAAVRRRYLAGELHLLPCPASLIPWNSPAYRTLTPGLRLAAQIPLLHLLERHEGGDDVRVPQAGWFWESPPGGGRPSGPAHTPVRETHPRPFRQDRVPRHAGLATSRENRMTRVLFSTVPGDIGLYHKPMGRNAQVWDEAFAPVLDGPQAGPDELARAAATVCAGGWFGYRFLAPAMRLGRHEVYWHRPLVAYRDGATSVLLADAPTGYLTAYHEAEPIPADPVELWPRFLRRQEHLDTLALFGGLVEDPPHRTLANVEKLFDAWERGGRKPLPRSLAQQLLTDAKKTPLDRWLATLAVKSPDREGVRRLVAKIEACLEPEPAPAKGRKSAEPASLTFKRTATRGFETAFWQTIAHLSGGTFANRNNGDWIHDPPTPQVLTRHTRDLDALGDYLLGYYARLVAEAGMSDVVPVGELPFRWVTQFPYPWMGGWLGNQDGSLYERNLLVVIPGKDRSRAVVMADHYDTAYMYDWYYGQYAAARAKLPPGQEPARRKPGEPPITGARLAAPGADDNSSATAALMLGAPVFLELSRQGRLGCDVWLLHLTGEEYPAEGQGALRMCQWLVEGTLGMRTADGGRLDLSGTRVQGLYVLDMIAHNNPNNRDVFQISPGASPEALWLARQAHDAAQAWNRGTETWNRHAARQAAKRGQRSRDGRTVPPLARFLPLSGEVRLHDEPRSTLFNTDGQMFSDVGVPVVLFMEDYDIARLGYHDTHDNMKKIDLDYGAALAAITIEAVARAATETPP